jgi:hypothetical protein
VGRKEMCRERTPKGVCMPLRYLFHSILVIISSDRPNRREKEMNSEKRNSEGGYAHNLEYIHQSTPAINSSDRLDR